MTGEESKEVCICGQETNTQYFRFAPNTLGEVNVTIRVSILRAATYPLIPVITCKLRSIHFCELLIANVCYRMVITFSSYLANTSIKLGMSEMSTGMRYNYGT